MFTRHESRHLAAYVTCRSRQPSQASRRTWPGGACRSGSRYSVCPQNSFGALVAKAPIQSTSVARPLTTRMAPANSFALPVPRWAVAALVAVVAVAGTGYWYSMRIQETTWEVRLDESSAATRLAAGEWIETEASRARITVGDIGTVDVEPGTRVRLGAARRRVSHS